MSVIFKVHQPFFVFSKSYHPMIASSIGSLKLTWYSIEFLICLSLLTFGKLKVTFWVLDFQIVSSLTTRLRDTALWFSFPVSSRELVSSVSMYIGLSQMLFTARPSVALKSQCASLWAVGYLVAAVAAYSCILKSPRYSHLVATWIYDYLSLIEWGRGLKSIPLTANRKTDSMRQLISVTWRCGVVSFWLGWSLVDLRWLTSIEKTVWNRICSSGLSSHREIAIISNR